MRAAVKRTLALILVASFVFSIAGCKSVKYHDEKEIRSILKNDLKLKEDDDYEFDEYRDGCEFEGEYDDIYFSIALFDDTKEAYHDFDDIADVIENDQDDFDGRIKRSVKDKSGYITFDGEGTESGDFFRDGDYYYGGVYYCDGMYIIVLTNKDKDSFRASVDEFLRAFRLPRP